MGKVIYVVSMIVGGLIAILGNSLGLGIATIIIGGFIGIMIAMPSTTSYNSTNQEEKKPYYKNEFEEYQHYKFVKKHMK